jgi:hypothetical protein
VIYIKNGGFGHTFIAQDLSRYVWLDKKIVYYSWDRHGPDVTKNFYDNVQKLTANWLLLNGFTVGRSG